MATSPRRGRRRSWPTVGPECAPRTHTATCALNGDSRVRELLRFAMTNGREPLRAPAPSPRKRRETDNWRNIATNQPIAIQPSRVSSRDRSSALGGIGKTRKLRFHPYHAFQARLQPNVRQCFPAFRCFARIVSEANHCLSVVCAYTYVRNARIHLLAALSKSRITRVQCRVSFSATPRHRCDVRACGSGDSAYVCVCLINFSQSRAT